MTDTLVGVSPLRKAGKRTLTPQEAERAAVRELVKAARARGEDLTGPDRLLKAITKQVIEAALEEEMTEHVRYDKHAIEGPCRACRAVPTVPFGAPEAARTGAPSASRRGQGTGKSIGGPSPVTPSTCSRSRSA
jgi:hypothetical protein